LKVTEDKIKKFEKVKTPLIDAIEQRAKDRERRKKEKAKGKESHGKATKLLSKNSQPK
jgi:hypothetical protein